MDFLAGEIACKQKITICMLMTGKSYVRDRVPVLLSVLTDR